MSNALFMKKTIELDRRAIKKLRRLCRVKTDKEAVNRAMKWVLEEDEIMKVHDALKGSVALESIFT